MVAMGIAIATESGVRIPCGLSNHIVGSRTLLSLAWSSKGPRPEITNIAQTARAGVCVKVTRSRSLNAPWAA